MSPMEASRSSLLGFALGSLWVGCTGLVQDLPCAADSNCPSSQVCSGAGICVVPTAEQDAGTPKVPTDVPTDDGGQRDGGDAPPTNEDAGPPSAGPTTDPPGADAGHLDGGATDAAIVDAAWPTGEDAGISAQDAGAATDAGAGWDSCDQDFLIRSNGALDVLADCTVVGGTLRMETNHLTRLSPISHIERIHGNWEMMGTGLNRDDLARMSALRSIGGVIRMQDNADLHVCRVEELGARLNPPVTVIDLGGNRNYNVCDNDD